MFVVYVQTVFQDMKSLSFSRAVTSSSICLSVLLKLTLDTAGVFESDTEDGHRDSAVSGHWR